jgi:hypothetical protein
MWASETAFLEYLWRKENMALDRRAACEKTAQAPEVYGPWSGVEE